MMMPYEFNSFVKELYANVPELENVTLGVKCSDELSMAAACAVSAVRAGAAEVDVTVGGGCAPALEAAAQIIRLRGDDYGYSCGLKYTELHRSVAQMNWITRKDRSRTSAFDTGMAISDGSDVRLDANDDIDALSKAVVRLGYDLTDEDMAKVYETFVSVARKKSVGTKELEAIIATTALQVPPTYELESYVINSGNIISADGEHTLPQERRGPLRPRGRRRSHRRGFPRHRADNGTPLRARRLPDTGRNRGTRGYGLDSRQAPLERQTLRRERNFHGHHRIEHHGLFQRAE